MQLQTSEIVKGSKLSSVHNLYNSYAAMLLGYIFEVVKNRKVAEQYLVAVFNDAAMTPDEFYKPGVNAFCSLQLIARKKLASFFEGVGECSAAEAVQKNTLTGKSKFIKLMTADQKLVFCGVYWQGKTTSKLAAELGRPDEDIRRVLKECFTIIRRSK